MDTLIVSSLRRDQSFITRTHLYADPDAFMQEGSCHKRDSHSLGTMFLLNSSPDNDKGSKQEGVGPCRYDRLPFRPDGLRGPKRQVFSRSVQSVTT